jgi:hypothetical protein
MYTGILEQNHGKKKNLKHTQLFVETQYVFKVAGTLQAFYVNPLTSDGYEWLMLVNDG